MSNDSPDKSGAPSAGSEMRRSRFSPSYGALALIIRLDAGSHLGTGHTAADIRNHQHIDSCIVGSTPCTAPRAWLCPPGLLALWAARVASARAGIERGELSQPREDE
jgi:hypothetical protein